MECILGHSFGPEPNMATMLSYILTDLDIPRPVLQDALADAVKSSFNCISVDGDQSTSDTVLLLSSQKVAATAADIAQFKASLAGICRDLAEDIVRNGEGTNHVIKVHVTNAPSHTFARDVGRFVVNSNLVKCAIAGCDPNVGRIVGAIGSYLGKSGSPDAIDVKNVKVTLGGIDIFNKGSFMLDPATEKRLSDYLLDCALFPSDHAEAERTYPPHSKTVDIGIELSDGNTNDFAATSAYTANCTVFGSDLTEEYVEVNADYRS